MREELQGPQSGSYLLVRLQELEDKAEDWELRAIGSGQKAELLDQRIAKAWEILEVTALDSESSWARTKAKEALDALEGK